MLTTVSQTILQLIEIFLHTLEKYEELNLSNYTNHDPNRLVIGDARNKDLSLKMEDLISQLKNPFDDLYFWIKKELYDLEAMQEAVLGRDSLD